MDDFHPSCYLNVFFPKKRECVLLGNKLKPSHTQIPPSVTILCPAEAKAKASSSFTVVLTDPDAPSRANPKWSQICHWIATVPTSTTEQDGHFPALMSVDGSFDEIVKFKPPGPPPKTGYHRYVFFVLQGDNTNLTAPRDRQHWGTGKEGGGVREWAAQEGLRVVGANFFYAKNKKQ